MDDYMIIPAPIEIYYDQDEYETDINKIECSTLDELYSLPRQSEIKYISIDCKELNLHEFPRLPKNIEFLLLRDNNDINVIDLTPYKFLDFDETDGIVLSKYESIIFVYVNDNISASFVNEHCMCCNAYLSYRKYKMKNNDDEYELHCRNCGLYISYAFYHEYYEYIFGVDHFYIYKGDNNPIDNYFDTEYDTLIIGDKCQKTDEYYKLIAFDNDFNKRYLNEILNDEFNKRFFK